MSLLFRSSYRYLFRHPWQMGLSTLGVAVAVAVVVGIDLANSSATRAFRLSVEGVAGKATHEISAGETGVDDSLYARLRIEGGFRRLAPVVEGYVRSPRLTGRPLRLFGVDPFAEALFRDFTRTLNEGEQTGDLAAFLTLPGAVMMSDELAGDLDVQVGESFDVLAVGRRHAMTLVGLVQPSDELARQSSRDVLVVDISTAQEVLNKVGRLTRIDLILEQDADTGEAASASRLRELLPPGAELASKSSRSGALDQMTRAFRLNLQALSLLALLVGLFLIYNTMTFSVVQRRSLIGTLRALGVTRREIFGLVVAEASLIAVIGSLVGLGLGVTLARGLLQLMVQTINDLYFVLSVQDVNLGTLGWLKGGLLGVVGTVAAALVPAREATQAPPRATAQRSHLERRARRALPRLAAIGVAILLAAALLAAAPSRSLPTSLSLPLSFASVFLVVLGSACLVPGLTFQAMRWLQRPMAALFGILGSLAARGVAATLSRTGVAVASLVIAVSMTIGVSIMIRSFRGTLIDWLEVTLQADVYIAPSGVGIRAARSLDPDLVRRLAAVPGVDSITTSRLVQVASPRGKTQVMAIDLDRRAFAIYSFTSGRPDDVWRKFAAGAAMVSESYAFHHNLEIGDQLELRTDRGPRSFEVAAIYYNYASDRGIVTLRRDTYERYWHDPDVESMGIYAAAGIDRADLIVRLRQAANEGQANGEGQQLVISANRDLRRGALEIFDRTFVITTVLRLLAVAVAFVGVLSALMALQLERARELGVLRANGLTPAQVWGLVTTQTGLMGLVSGLLAMPLGVVLAFMLIHIINKRSFGWTLRMEMTPGMLLQALVLALVAALLAGVYPSYRMSKSSPALALREE